MFTFLLPLRGRNGFEFLYLYAFWSLGPIHFVSVSDYCVMSMFYDDLMPPALLGCTFSVRTLAAASARRYQRVMIADLAEHALF